MKWLRKLLLRLWVISILLVPSTGVLAVTEDEIDAAIDKGVEWLVAQQRADGSWGTWFPVGQTGLAVVSLCEHAVDWKYGYGLTSPFDEAYPYRDNVIRGLNYLFAHAYLIPISLQPAGNPDTNGNGVGVYFAPYYRTYQTGVVMMAIAASRAPDRVVDVPGSPVNGWTYKDVLQDAVDYFAFGQMEDPYGRGGWGYYENEAGWRSDNSNSGWATFGLGFAESPAYGFECTIPDFVKSELSIWIDYIQNKDGWGWPDDPLGGSGYEHPHSWVNILKTGHLLYEMALVGDTAETPRVKAAVNYLVRHWNDPNPDPGWRGWPGEVASYHATFNVMKGLTALGIEKIDGINWQSEFEDVLVAQQLGDGSWPVCYWSDWERILSTEWALLTLQKVVPPLKVVIDIKPSSFPNSINPRSKGVIPVGILTTRTDIGEPVTFDATTVNAETVRFGPAGAKPVRWAIKDVDGDSDSDMILHFRTQETGIKAGDTEATLTGETLEGLKFFGTDSVRTVPPRRK